MTSRADSWVYGGVLALALIGGGVAIFGRSADPPTDTPADAPPSTPREGAAVARPDPVEEPSAERGRANPAAVSDSEPDPEPRARPLPPEFVPDLPAVPNLLTEPPPPRPEVDDPRMAQLATEMRMLTRARELIDTEPREALALLTQHRQQHPDGVLRLERDAFLIEALVALGRANEAERRYYDFRARYPDSELNARLAELLAAVPDPDSQNAVPTSTTLHPRP